MNNGNIDLLVPVPGVEMREVNPFLKFQVDPNGSYQIVFDLKHKHNLKKSKPYAYFHFKDNNSFSELAKQTIAIRFTSILSGKPNITPELIQNRLISWFYDNLDDIINMTTECLKKVKQNE